MPDTAQQQQWRQQQQDAAGRHGEMAGDLAERKQRAKLAMVERLARERGGGSRASGAG